MLFTKYSLPPSLISGMIWLLIAATWSTPVVANTVLVSEIYPAPNPGEPEWFELFNYGESDIELNGWTAYDKLSSPSLLTSFSHHVIKSYEALVITVAGAKLNNGGDGITLYRGDGAVVDSLSFLTSQTGYSWHREASQSADLFQDLPSPNFWIPAIDQDKTPTPMPTNVSQSPSPTNSPSPNQVPSTSPTPTSSIDISGVVISEVLSCPISPETEWIELWNTQDNSILLENWSITDLQNNRVTFTQDLPANQHIVISWSKSMLNNAGDTAMLEDSARQPRLVLEIPSCVPGHSFALVDNEYLWVSPPSKGASNQSAIPAHSPSPISTPSPTHISNQFAKPTITTLATGNNRPDHATQSARISNYLPTAQFFTMYTSSASAHPTIAHSSAETKLSADSGHVSPWPYLNVIIGGSLIASSGCLLYVKPNIDTVDI